MPPSGLMQAVARVYGRRSVVRHGGLTLLDVMPCRHLYRHDALCSPPLEFSAFYPLREESIFHECQQCRQELLPAEDTESGNVSRHLESRPSACITTCRNRCGHTYHGDCIRLQFPGQKEMQAIDQLQPTDI